MTALGASIVFFFQGAIHPKLNRAFLGFASGVMMAASVWSLLLPSIAQSQEQGFVAWLPPAAGFAFGGVFLYAVDKTLPWFHADYKGRKAGTKLLVLAVTVHNIPEGMAVAVPLISGGMGRARAAGAAALTGAPTVLGALLGFCLGTLGPTSLTLALSFASGAMLYVVFGELLPESALMWRSKAPALAAVLGIITGMVIVYA